MYIKGNTDPTAFQMSLGWVHEIIVKNTLDDAWGLLEYNFKNLMT